MKRSSVFLDMRRCKDWDHKICSWKYPNHLKTCPTRFPGAQRALLPPERPCGGLKVSSCRSTVSTEADDKRPCHWQSLAMLLAKASLWKKVKVKALSRVRPCVTPWTVAHQAPPPWGSPGNSTGVGCHFPSPGDLPDPGVEPRFPTFQADTLTSGSTTEMKNKIKTYLETNKNTTYQNLWCSRSGSKMEAHNDICLKKQANKNLK